VTRDGRVHAAGIQPSGYQMVPQKLIKTYSDEVRRIESALGASPRAIGLAFSGAVDPSFGVVYLPGKVKGLEGFPVVPELRKLTGVPVIADNDGRISIYAESRFGLAKTYRWAVTITIGTGVGSGVMLDGRILRDPHLQFGTQMGHIVQQAAGGRLCITGARGTAEMMCSATALTMAVRDGLQRGIPSVLSDNYFDDPTTVDFETIIRAVEEADALCLDEFQHWTKNLGWLLVSTVHVYAPEIIILSGGATHAARHFLEPLRAHVAAHTFRYPTDQPVPIEVSTLLDHTGVLGTAALAWEHLDARDS
jgi:glucokinase